MRTFMEYLVLVQYRPDQTSPAPQRRDLYRCDSIAGRRTRLHRWDSWWGEASAPNRKEKSLVLSFALLVVASPSNYRIA